MVAGDPETPRFIVAIESPWISGMEGEVSGHWLIYIIYIYIYITYIQYIYIYMGKKGLKLRFCRLGRMHIIKPCYSCSHAFPNTGSIRVQSLISDILLHMLMRVLHCCGSASQSSYCHWVHVYSYTVQYKIRTYETLGCYSNPAHGWRLARINSA